MLYGPSREAHADIKSVRLTSVILFDRIRKWSCGLTFTQTVIYLREKKSKHMKVKKIKKRLFNMTRLFSL